MALAEEGGVVDGLREIGFGRLDATRDRARIRTLSGERDDSSICERWWEMRIEGHLRREVV